MDGDAYLYDRILHFMALILFIFTSLDYFSNTFDFNHVHLRLVLILPIMMSTTLSSCFSNYNKSIDRYSFS